MTSPPVLTDEAAYRAAHQFLGTHHDRNARRTWAVVGITVAMMALEIGCGLLFHSMALLADGVHMGTHAGALTIAALAYHYARRHQFDRRFALGTAKVGDLAGFANALFLGLVALGIAIESIDRLAHPVPVAFGQAILVAALGLVVNLGSALVLSGSHDHGHGQQLEDAHRSDHGHAHGHAHHHDTHDRHRHADHNLLAAYAHLLTDAATSLLAILALSAGRYLGWVQLDPGMGIVSALVIGRWSVRLLRQTGRVLLDHTDGTLAQRAAAALRDEQTILRDLHVWRLGPGHVALIASLETSSERTLEDYRRRLDHFHELAHITIEIARRKSMH